MARALALGLSARGAAPPLIWGRDPGRLAEAAGPAQAAPSLADLVAQCEVIALAVSDDALSTLAKAIAALPARLDGTLVFHVSGASGIAVLEPLRARGAMLAAIHPAMTFTGDAARECARMAGASFAVTASDDAAREIAQGLVAMLGGVPVAIPEAHRTLYHAALCHSANHLVTLLDGAMQALAATGAKDPANLIAPLVRATLENTLALGFDALSGPLLRGDAGTVRGHLGALERDCPQVLPAYRAMAHATLDELDRRAGQPDRTALHETLHETPRTGAELSPLHRK